MDADQVFKYFSRKKAMFVKELDNPLLLVKRLDILLDKDPSCMSTSKSRRMISQSIRCVNCKNLSQLVADETREIGKPFTIESGENMDKSYVVQVYPVDSDVLIDANRIGDHTHVCFSSFMHSIIMSCAVDDIVEQQTLVSAWICNKSGFILKQQPTLTKSNTDPNTTFLKFKHFLTSMWSAGYIHYNVTGSTLTFDDRDDNMVISVSDHSAASLVWKNVRFYPDRNIRKISKTGHPVDIEGFSASTRFVELFDSGSLDTDYAEIFTIYSLLTCLLLTGRWSKHLKIQMESLFGDIGMVAINNYFKTSREPPTTESIRDILRYTVMSKTKLRTFLER